MSDSHQGVLDKTPTPREIVLKAMKKDHDDLCLVPGCGRVRSPLSRYCRVHTYAGRSDGLMERPLRTTTGEPGAG